jgi:hypothetical protein
MQFFVMFGIIFATFLVSFALINIRHIFTGNEFRGSCSSNNPMIKNTVGDCTVCGRPAGEECGLPEPGKA